MWEKIKAWLKNKLLPWAKKEWLEIGTFVMLLIVYGSLPTESFLGGIVGLWIFVILATLGWRLFKGPKKEPAVPPVIIHDDNPPKPRTKPNVPEV